MKQIEFPEQPMLPTDLLKLLEAQDLQDSKQEKKQRSAQDQEDEKLSYLLVSAQLVIEIIQQQEQAPDSDSDLDSEQDREKAQKKDQELDSKQDAKAEDRQIPSKTDSFEYEGRVPIKISEEPDYKQAQLSLREVSDALKITVQQENPTIKLMFSTVQSIRNFAEKKRGTVTNREAYHLEVIQFYEWLQYYYLQNPHRITRIRQVKDLLGNSFAIYDIFNASYPACHKGIKVKQLNLYLLNIELLEKISGISPKFFMKDCITTLIKYYEYVLKNISDPSVELYYRCARWYFSIKNYQKAQEWFDKLLKKFSSPQYSSEVANACYYLLLIAEQLQIEKVVIHYIELLSQRSLSQYLDVDQTLKVRSLWFTWGKGLSGARLPTPCRVEEKADVQSSSIPLTVSLDVEAKAAAPVETVSTTTVASSASMILSYSGSLVRQHTDGEQQSQAMDNRSSNLGAAKKTDATVIELSL